jgi:lysophospholipase L1-like esterase
MSGRNVPKRRGSSTRRVFLGALLLTIMLLAVAHFASGPTLVRIMPLGDSITAGVTDLPADRHTGYREPLWSQLIADGYHVDFVGSMVNGPDTFDNDHEGHEGFRIGQLVEGISVYLAAKPDVILLHAGTNDLLQGIAPEKAAQLLGVLLDRIHELRPSAYVVVASILPVRAANFYHASPHLFSDFNSHVEPLVAARAALGWRISHVDMAAEVALKPFEFDSLGIHPSPSGYARMAAVWRAELKTILADKRTE